MNLKKLLVCVALGGFSLLNAKENVMKGRKVNAQLHTASTSELFSMLRRSPKTHCDKKCKANPGCIVNTPIDPVGDVFQNPNAPAVAFFPNAGAKNSLKSPTQSVGFKFFAGSPQFHPLQLGTPPDTMGVVGPEQFIIAINQGIVSFDKKTGERDWVLNTGPSEFGVPNEMLEGGKDDTFDPRIRYDTFSKRWYIMYTLRNPSFFNGGFYLAVSDGQVITPCTQWKLLFIPNNTLVPNSEGCIGDLGPFFDYPRLGIDKHAVYIVANISVLEFLPELLPIASSVFVIPKEPLLCSDKPIVSVFRDISGFPNQSERPFSTPIASSVDNFDSDAQFGYLIEGTPYRYGQFNIWRIVNPGSNQPSLVGPFAIDVPTTAYSVGFGGVPEKNNPYGVAGRLGTLPCQWPMSTHVRNGQLYAVHHNVVDKRGISVWDEVNQLALGDRVGARWYQIDLTGDSKGNAGNPEKANTAPVLVQAGTLFDARDTDAPLSYIMPSIMTNKNEDMVIGATLTGPDSLAKAFFVSRRKNDPLGTLRVGPNYEGIVFAESSGIFTRSLDSFPFIVDGIVEDTQRWGDYSMTSVDPNDGTTLWTIQEVHRGIIEDLWVARLDAK